MNFSYNLTHKEFKGGKYNKKIEFTREDTSIAKGIAIILMFTHHLFTFPDRIRSGSEYLSLFSISGDNIELIVGRFGKICVAMFLFLSGFGIYKQFIKDKNNIYFILFNKIKKIYINYWIIFLIFIPISFVLGIREFNLVEFFNNFIAYKSTYNGE